MADFCMECSIENFGKDCRDLANLGKPLTELKPGHGYRVLCEGCGPILVDDDGKRMGSKPCQHVKYTAKDFTWEEISRANIIAVAVMRDKRVICKCCGHERPKFVKLGEST